MSALTHDESARRFCETIGIKGGALKKPTPVLQPPGPVEIKPEAKPDKNNFSKRMDDELSAQVEFERHPDLFDDTPGGWENVQLVLDYVQTYHDGYFSRASVQDANKTLRRQGELLPLFKPEPVAPSSKQPQPVVQPAPQPVVQDLEAGLPPINDYIKRVLGNNPLRTRKDVNRIPSQLYSDLYRGPHQATFKARVEAAARR